MPTMEPAVYYRDKDYLGVVRRLLIDAIDTTVAAARIVNLRGERPRRLALLGRLLFAVLGPANFLVDLLWVSSDPSKQALRDKIAHPYVIRKNAAPAGTGQIVYRTYTVFAWTLLAAEVRPDVTGAVAPD